MASLSRQASAKGEPAPSRHCLSLFEAAGVPTSPIAFIVNTAASLSSSGDFEIGSNYLNGPLDTVAVRQQSANTRAKISPQPTTLPFALWNIIGRRARLRSSAWQRRPRFASSAPVC